MARAQGYAKYFKMSIAILDTMIIIMVIEVSKY